MTVITPTRRREELKNAEIYHLSFAKKSEEEKLRSAPWCRPRPTKLILLAFILVQAVISGLIYVVVSKGQGGGNNTGGNTNDNDQTGLRGADNTGGSTNANDQTGLRGSEDGDASSPGQFISTHDTNEQEVHNTLLVESILDKRTTLDEGRYCIFTIEELDLILGRWYDWIKPVPISNLKEDLSTSKDGMVLRAKNTRSNKSGGLLVWSDGHAVYGAWNPIKDTATDDWKKGDTIELLDFPRPQKNQYKLAEVRNYKAIDSLEWGETADHVRFGESGVIGAGWRDFKIEYELQSDELPVIGVWSDSDMAPYTITYQDDQGSWIVLRKNCQGSTLFPSGIKSRNWRLHWEEKSYKDLLKRTGLSSIENGGGLHAELLVQPLDATSHVISPTLILPEGQSKPSTAISPIDNPTEEKENSPIDNPTDNSSATSVEDGTGDAKPNENESEEVDTSLDEVEIDEGDYSVDQGAMNTGDSSPGERTAGHSNTLTVEGNSNEKSLLAGGRYALFSIEELDVILGRWYDWIKPVDMSNLKEDLKISKDNAGGMVLRAKNTRSNKEGGLLIWTDGHVAYGAWNPLKDTTTDDWKRGDTVELLDFPRPKQSNYDLAEVRSYKAIGDLEWGETADHVRFGESGVVGAGSGDFIIEYELLDSNPRVVGIWSDSVMAPYTIKIQNRNGKWIVFKQGCKGSTMFNGKVRARKWRIEWKGSSYKFPLKASGLSSNENGGGFHAEFLVRNKNKK